MKEVGLASTLSRVTSKRKKHLLSCMICFHLGSFISDKDLKTEGFELESCRSMIALMDVSFSGERGVRDTTLVHSGCISHHYTHNLVSQPGKQNSSL